MGKRRGNEGGKREERRGGHTYKMRFIIVVFLNFGPSLLGKLHVLKIPP